MFLKWEEKNDFFCPRSPRQNIVLRSVVWLVQNNKRRCPQASDITSYDSALGSLIMSLAPSQSFGSKKQAAAIRPAEWLICGEVRGCDVSLSLAYPSLRAVGVANISRWGAADGWHSATPGRPGRSHRRKGLQPGTGLSTHFPCTRRPLSMHNQWARL